MLALMTENRKEHKRPLTPEERTECARLKAIFEKKKKELDLTQRKIGENTEPNIEQATVSQYLNGRSALNLDFATVCARLLQVDIGEFSPRLKKEALKIASIASADQKYSNLKLIDVERPHKVVVHSFAQIINKEKGQMMDYQGDVPPNMLFMTLESDIMYGMNGLHAPKGAILMIAKDEAPKIGDTALFNVAQSAAVGEYCVVGGVPYVRPTNSQYPLIDVSEGQLIGVVTRTFFDAKRGA